MVARIHQASAMTLCPVALAVGCRKCPIFAVCPAKGAIGDYEPDKPDDSAKTASGKEGKGSRGR
jgi:hypothetical protein